MLLDAFSTSIYIHKLSQLIDYSIENTMLSSDSSVFNILTFLDIYLKKCAEIRN